MKDSLFNLYYKHKMLIENFSYLSFLQIFLLIYPLITYPYLVRVLGRELYGVILTAQMLASYASLIIDFGSNYVCAKHVSVYRNDKDKLSEIISNVLAVRFVFFIICFLIYFFIILVIPDYRNYFWIFLLTYGFTSNELLFPQFFFQGIEKMKFISIINIASKILMVVLIFLLVNTKDDVLLVPIIYSFGFFLGGFISIYLIIAKMKIKLVRPTINKSLYYLKDSSPIFVTDVICSIKDKLSYLLVGMFVGMSDVVIYDLGQKLHGIAAKPYTLICTVMFPRLAKNRNFHLLKKIAIVSFSITLLLIAITNLFLEEISYFFLNERIELLSLRLFLFGPLLLSVSYVISNNLFVAFGYNRYMFYSILVTTIVYFICLLAALLLGCLNSILTFICIALISYTVELLYRLFAARKILVIEQTRPNHTNN